MGEEKKKENGETRERDGRIRQERSGSAEEMRERIEEFETSLSLERAARRQEPGNKLQQPYKSPNVVEEMTCIEGTSVENDAPEA